VAPIERAAWRHAAALVPRSQGRPSRARWLAPVSRQQGPRAPGRRGSSQFYTSSAAPSARQHACRSPAAGARLCRQRRGKHSGPRRSLEAELRRQRRQWPDWGSRERLPRRAGRQGSGRGSRIRFDPGSNRRLGADVPCSPEQARRRLPSRPPWSGRPGNAGAPAAPAAGARFAHPAPAKGAAPASRPDQQKWGWRTI